MAGSAGVTFSGIGSGLPVQQLIDATMTANSYRLNAYTKSKDSYTKQQNAYKSVETKFRSFDSTLQKIVDSKMIYAFDLFDRKSTTVSDNGVASVSVSQGALNGTAQIDVHSLAKPPSQSVANFGAPIKSNIPLNQMGIIDGSMSFAFETPAGGVEVNANVVFGDTLETYITKLNTAIATSNDGLTDTTTGKIHNSGLSGNVTYSVDTNGVVSLDFSGVTGGTLNDQNPFAQAKSNFGDVLGFTVSGNTLVGVPKSSLNLDGKLSDNGAGIKNLGTLTLPETINIGGLDIDVTADSTLRQIMNAVNESTTCQVTMSYDQTTNSMNFKAKDDSYSDYIYFSGKALLSDIGVTDANGSVNTLNQTKRQQGEIVLNGKTIAIKSNKVTAAETGLSGININLFSVTKSDEPLKISVSDNTSDIINAMKDVVGAFNALGKTISDYTFVDTETGETGALNSDYSISSMQTSLQMIMMSPISEELDYKALSLVGITTEDGNFKFDESKFINALKANSSDLKKLLVGDKEKTIKGIFEKVQSQLDVYLDSQSGFFTTKASSMQRSIKDLNRSITDEESRLEQQRQRLVQQYSQLDSIMSKYQSQSGSFSTGS